MATATPKYATTTAYREDSEIGNVRSHIRRTLEITVLTDKVHDAGNFDEVVLTVNGRIIRRFTYHQAIRYGLVTEEF